jgi:hypothetical protein
MSCTARITVVALTLVGVAALTPAASGREPPSSTGDLSASSAWTEPVAALGAISLAAYLADHQARRRGPFGV